MVGVRGPLKPRIYSAAGPKSPRREQNAQQIGVNRLATSILNARFIVWRQTPARYNWPLIRVRQKVNSSLGRAFPPPSIPLASQTSLSPSLLPPTDSSFFVRDFVLSPTHFSLPSLSRHRADRPLSVARPGTGGVSPSRAPNSVIDGFLGSGNDGLAFSIKTRRYLNSLLFISLFLEKFERSCFNGISRESKIEDKCKNREKNPTMCIAFPSSRVTIGKGISHVGQFPSITYRTEIQSWSLDSKTRWKKSW